MIIPYVVYFALAVSLVALLSITQHIQSDSVYWSVFCGLILAIVLTFMTFVLDFTGVL